MLQHSCAVKLQKYLVDYETSLFIGMRVSRYGGFQRCSVTWRNCLDSDGLPVAVLGSLNTKRFLWLAYFKRQVCPRFTTEQLLMWSCIRRKCSVCISSRWTQRSTDSELLLLYRAGVPGTAGVRVRSLLVGRKLVADTLTQIWFACSLNIVLCLQTYLAFSCSLPHIAAQQVN